MSEVTKLKLDTNQESLELCFKLLQVTKHPISYSFELNNIELNVVEKDHVSFSFHKKERQ